MSMKQNTKQIIEETIDSVINSSALKPRERSVLVCRFGLKKSKQQTLQEIGDAHGITREWVRQIEKKIIAQLKNNDVMELINKTFLTIEEHLKKLGGVVSLKTLIEEMGGNAKTKNQLVFLATLNDIVSYKPSDEFFNERLIAQDDDTLANCVEKALKTLHVNSKAEDSLLPEEAFLNTFRNCVRTELQKKSQSIPNSYDTEDTLLRWVGLTHTFGCNPYGQWGCTTSPFVRLANTRDRICLILENEGKPFHFSEISEKIRKDFNKNIKTTTCHNELIRCDTFVLKGRGRYALRHWDNVVAGTVREVITGLLKRNKKMLASDIIAEVTRVKDLKKGTIRNALYDKKLFKKLPGDYYTLA